MLSQKGLAPILIIILVGTALLGGYFVYQNKIAPFPQSTIKPSSNPVLTSTPQSSPKPTTSAPADSQIPSSTLDACSYDGAPFNPHPFKRELSTRPDYNATGVVNVKGLITAITVKFFGQESKG